MKSHGNTVQKAELSPTTQKAAATPPSLWGSCDFPLLPVCVVLRFFSFGPHWTFPYEHMAPSDYPVKGASAYFWEKVYWLTSGLTWEKVHRLTIWSV